MKKLDLHDTCPKCGFGTRIGEWKSSITLEYISQIKLPDPNCIRTDKVIHGSDYIRRCCPRCGYEWSETCLDAEDEDMRVRIHQEILETQTEPRW